MGVVMCCASCRHKQFDRQMRLCMIGQGNVKPYHCCSRWSLNPDLDSVGKGDGMVKKRDYLMFALDRLGEAVNQRDIDIEKVRMDYEAQHGDIYIDF